MSVNYNGTEYFYLKNAQGDVTGLVNTSGTQVVAYTYDAWGNPLTTTGSMASTLGKDNPFRYRSYFYDTETGLYYLGSRYYNPATGRFINADSENLITATPESATWDKNLFAYCDNNPVVRVDGEGQFWHIVISGIINAGVNAALETATQVKAIRQGELNQLDGVAILITACAGAISGIVSATGLGFGFVIGANSIVGAAESVAMDVHTNSTTTNYSAGQIIARATVNAGTSALTTFVSGPSNGTTMTKSYKEAKVGATHLRTKGTTPTKNRMSKQQLQRYKNKIYRYTGSEVKGSVASASAGKVVVSWLQKLFGLDK